MSQSNTPTIIVDASSNLPSAVDGPVGYAVSQSQHYGLRASTWEPLAYSSAVPTSSYFQSAGVSTGGNTAGTTGLVGSRIVFVGGQNVTLSQSANGASATVSIVGASTTVAPNRKWVEIIPGEQLSPVAAMTASNLSNRPMFFPFNVEGDGLVASSVRMIVSQVTNTQPWIFTVGVGLYSSVGNSSMGLIASTTATYNLSTTQSASYSGIRIMDVTGITNSISEGRYVLGVFFSAANTSNCNLSLYGAAPMPAWAGFVYGGNSTATTAGTLHVVPFWGVYTANSGALPSGMASGAVNGGRSADTPEVYAILKQI